MGVFVVKRYAVREAKKWRYAVRKAKIGRYAVRKGEGGVTLLNKVSCLRVLFFSTSNCSVERRLRTALIFPRMFFNLPYNS